MPELDFKLVPREDEDSVRAALIRLEYETQRWRELLNLDAQISPKDRDLRSIRTGSNEF